MVYFGILCETMPLMLTILTIKLPLIVLYCNSNVNSGTITYEANIMFMW